MKVGVVSEDELPVQNPRDLKSDDRKRELGGRRHSEGKPAIDTQFRKPEGRDLETVKVETK